MKQSMASLLRKAAPIVAVGVVLTAATTAQAYAAPQKVADVAEDAADDLFSDYLEIEVGGNDEECSKPLAEREGAWLCASEEETSDSVNTFAVADGGTSVGVKGTWTSPDKYRTAFNGTAPYGYGTTALGKVTLSFKTVASGRHLIISKASFKSTRGTKSPTLEAEILYTSTSQPYGKAQTPRQSDAYGKNSLNANHWMNWPATTPDWIQTVQNPTAVVEAVWRDPSSAYKGRWYFYAKSIKYKKQADKTYKVSSPRSKPKLPMLGGWSAS